MYTRNDITPEDMAHIKKLCAELSVDLHQRVARHRRRMIIIHNSLAFILVLLPILATNIAHASPSTTLSNKSIPCTQIHEQITTILQNK